MTDVTPPGTTSGHRDHPDVLAVCRWLPQAYPWGAFTGRHDRVHFGARQGFVNLWWSDHTVHVGEYVGPPRGGLIPDPAANYNVAMPAGGYLHVQRGTFVNWAMQPTDDPIVRADGEAFSPQAYGPAQPYWLSQYQAMTQEDRLNSLAAVHRRSLQSSSARSDAPASSAVVPEPRPEPHRDHHAQAISEWVRSSRQPVVCGCDSNSAMMHPGLTLNGRGLNVPNALLRHGGAVATLAGMGGADDACDVVWNLTYALADPAQAGLVRAAEVAARRSADTVSGWPDGPLTEDAVALVAAQALRWHGRQVAERLPFWTLGWIFMAGPILDDLLPPLPHNQLSRLRAKVLDQADRVRVDRVLRTWAAANDASKAIQSAQDAASETTPFTPERAAEVIDLRENFQAPAFDEPRVSTNHETTEYRQTVGSVIAQLAQDSTL